ncbi:hypothetical protein [Streptomyces sp. NPDC057939]|uniref:hypothetical protein n=1 Tax=Streptomyces sp. NPDC057939 TaxID=3346284 RepID=UPI0036EF9C2E
MDAFFGTWGPSLKRDIEQHVYRNPGDWSTEGLCENLGAFEAGDARFAPRIHARHGVLWGPRIMEARGAETSLAAVLTAMSGLGLAVGAPLFNLLSDHWNNLRIPAVIGVLLQAAAVALLIYLPKETNSVSVVTVFCVGLFAGAHMLGFTVPGRLVGSSAAIVNGVCFIIGGLLQAIPGKLLPDSPNLTDYGHALLIMPILLVLGALAGLFGPGERDEPVDPHLVAAWDSDLPCPARHPGRMSYVDLLPTVPGRSWSRALLSEVAGSIVSMSMVRTTPPRPFDIAAAFPELGALARTATRLHPRPGMPTWQDSSIGGPLLWPADEPWPYCDLAHDSTSDVALADLRLQQRVRASAAAFPDGDPQSPQHTAEERAVLDRLHSEETWLDDAWLDGPVAMVPLAQLYLRDVPALRPPGRAGADLLQVLWCPFDHPPEHYMPKSMVVWRSAAAVTEILVSPPAPPVVVEEYVPEPCVVAPEQVTEYPSPADLSKELRERIQDWTSRQAADTAVDGAQGPYSEADYASHLSVAPGWKVGGWPSWGYTDPAPRPCSVCGTEREPLLTIASSEWEGAGRSWIPLEDQAAAFSTDARQRDGRKPTRVQIGDCVEQQLYICPTAPEHPHIELMQ